MSKKKSNTENIAETIKSEEANNNSDVVISDKSDIVPSEEVKPDQSVLYKPAPKKGITLKESWGHNKHLKNK